MTRRGRTILVISILFAAGAILAYGIWKPARSEPALSTPPEIPASVQDDEVRETLTAARDRVLSEPQSGEAWGELGLTFRAHNLNPESNACFAIAAKLDPNNPRWPYLIGAINLLIEPENAIPHLRTAFELATEPAHQSAIRCRLAEAQLAAGDIDSAAALFADETRINPRNPRGHFGLGTVAAARGNAAAAVAAFQKSLESPFSRKRSSALLAANHRRLGNLAEAERLERIAAETPDDLDWLDPILAEYLQREAGRMARMKAAEKLEAQGKLRETVTELANFASANPDDQAMVSLAINVAKTGDDAGAERILRVVVERSPEHAVARYFLGIAIYMQAERDWLAGKQDAAKPRFEAAVVELRKAAALKPDKGLANLYAGLALKYLGKLPEALAECQAAVHASPHLADTHLGMGEVLVAMGNPTAAKAHLETAVRLSQPGDTRSMKLLDAIAKKP